MGDDLVADEPPSAASRLRGAVIEVITTAILAVVIYLVVQTFIVQTYQVKMESMVPNLLPEQHVLVDKLTPHFDDYSRGDVVVFHPPQDIDDSGTPFIKRVIGVGGDHVQIRGGAVVINGVQMPEPYIATDGLTEPKCDGQTSWDVPEDELFLLGDHREASDDSRCFGTVKVSSVIGRAWLRFWPLNTFTILPTPTYPPAPPLE